MHILACRLPKQEEARGYVSKDGELWVERGIQRVKRNVKYRTTEHPEKLFAHDLMADMALARMRHSDEAAGTTPPPPPQAREQAKKSGLNYFIIYERSL